MLASLSLFGQARGIEAHLPLQLVSVCSSAVLSGSDSRLVALRTALLLLQPAPDAVLSEDVPTAQSGGAVAARLRHQLL